MTDQSPPAERRPINAFSDLIPPEWRDPADYAAVILEFYSSGIALESPVRKLTEYARSVVRSVCSHPVTWHYLRFTQDQPVSSLTARSVYSEGERSIIAHYGEDVIPVGDYIVFASPVLRAENGGTAEAEPTHALRAARGALMALGGHMAAEQLILRTMPSTEKLDHMTRTAGPFENYEPPEMFAYCGPESIAQLGAKMAIHMDPEHRQRLSTALAFVGRAATEMDSTVRFSHLWIALEVAAGGYGKLNVMFQKIATEEGARTKLADIKGARDQLFHHGRRYSLSQDQERLMCAAIIAQLLSWFGVKDEKLSAVIDELGKSGASGLVLDDD
jgi:hypothetical protein